MKLEDLQRIEDQKRERQQRAIGKKILAGKVNPSLPGVRDSGLVIAMSPEERAAMFEKMRKESGVE